MQSEEGAQLPALRWAFDQIRGLPPDPCLLCGDFNAASHLDYADEGGPFGRVDWPCSRACFDEGFVDTYARANPGHLGAWSAGRHDAQGITWTTMLNKEPGQIYDRVDFVYASDEHLAHIEESMTVDDSHPRCRRDCTPWPSDHRAVFTKLFLKHAQT